MLSVENRCARYYAARVAAGILSLLLLTAAAGAAGPRRGAEFPHELVHFEPATKGVIFAGTGKDTWDQKIRERSCILCEGRTWRLSRSRRRRPANEAPA